MQYEQVASFSGPSKRFANSEIAGIDPSLVGVYVVYELVKVGGKDDFRPIFWGHGTIRQGLQKALSNPCVAGQPLLQCNYIEINDPVKTLKEYDRLRKALPPKCT